MRATKVNAGLAESNGRLLLGIWRDSLHVTCGLTACTPGSAPGPTLGNEYGKTLLYFYPWVALPPSVPSTHRFHRQSPPHCFIPGLKTSFSANPSHRSLSFLLQDWLRAFPGLFTDTSEHIRFSLLVFLFSTFLLVPCGRLSWFMSAFDCTLLYCIVSYRMDSFIDYTVSQKNKTPNSCP